MERTLIIVKPDAMQRGLMGEIVNRFERRGLKFAGMKLIHIDDALARKHYAIHEGKPFFEKLVTYISSGPVLIAVLEGTNAIRVVRATVGGTNPAEAAPGTIRADFALEIGRNLVHASDSEENAQKEIKLYFKDAELYTVNRETDKWIFE